MKLLTGMLLGVLVITFSASSHAMMSPGLYYAMMYAKCKQNQQHNPYECPDH